MKGLLYVVALLLSLPNLLAGTAVLLIKHTFSTRNPLYIINDFLFGLGWSLPLAASLFVLLLVLGFFSMTRPYAALFAFVLNIAALGSVLYRVRAPSDLDEAVFFIPVLLALIGFAWIAYPCFAARPTEDASVI